MIEDPRLDADLRNSLADGQPVSREVRDIEGRSYLRTVEPCRISGADEGGYRVTYTPILQKEAQGRRAASHEWQTRLIAELGQKALATRDLAAFIEEACHTLCQAFGCAFGKIVKLNEDRTTYHLVAASGFPHEEVAATDIAANIRSQAGYTLHVEHSVIVDDIETDDRLDGPALLKGLGVRSGISTTIMVGGKPWGVIGFYDTDTGRFNEDDLAVLESVAHILAMTVMQATREEFLSRERIIQSLIMGVAEIGVWTMDIETRDIVWDHRFRRITGLLDANVPFDDTEFGARVAEEDRERFEQGLRGTIRDGEPHDLELRFFPPDRDMIWLQLRGERVEQNGRAMIVGIIADLSERKQSEERSEFMMRELDHRVKNLLAIILSIAEITSRSNTDIEGYKNDFRGRLESMARTHNLLAQTQWSGMDLRALIEEEILSFAPEEAIAVAGPSLTVSPTAAQSLAMFLHELTANAFKHGALSRDEGRIEVRWSIESGGGSTLRLVWQESGGPRVSRPDREGFGSKVINRIVKRQLDADVQTDWCEEGLCLTASIPMASILPPSIPDNPPQAHEEPFAAQDLIKNRRVMVVDDDWLVAEQHAKAFASVGAAIAGPFLSPVAIPPDELSGLDLAILALSAEHRDEIVLLADALRAEGVPIVFLVSKDSPVDLPERFGEPAVLFKPATVDALIDVGARHIADRLGADRLAAQRARMGD